MLTRQGHLPGLDGLRALACLMVFAVHFGQITHVAGSWGPFELDRLLENGNTGVALFFALSGFVLAMPYWSAALAGAPRPAIATFYLRRAARIAPAYFACLCILIVANRHWQEDGWIANTLLHLAFAFNFDATTIFSFNPPFWTLAVEAQFYVLLPLLLLPLDRNNHGRVAAALLLLGLACYIGHYALMSGAMATIGGPPAYLAKANPVLEYSLLAHLPHFILGVLSARVFLLSFKSTGTAVPSRKRGLDMPVLLIISLLVLIIATPIDEWLQVPFGRYNLPFVPILICALIVFTPVTVLGNSVLDSAPLRGLGAISFGVYIYHLPVQHVTARTMAGIALPATEHWAIFGAFSLFLTVVVASISYWLLERPIIRLARSV